VIGSFIVVLFLFGFAWYANAMVNRMLDDFYDEEFNRELNEFNRMLDKFDNDEK